MGHSSYLHVRHAADGCDHRRLVVELVNVLVDGNGSIVVMVCVVGSVHWRLSETPSRASEAA